MRFIEKENGEQVAIFHLHGEGFLPPALGQGIRPVGEVPHEAGLREDSSGRVSIASGWN